MMRFMRYARRGTSCYIKERILPFLKKLIVTIDITSSACYSMLIRCNNKNYIKKINIWKQGGCYYDTDGKSKGTDQHIRDGRC